MALRRLAFLSVFRLSNAFPMFRRTFPLLSLRTAAGFAASVTLATAFSISNSNSNSNIVHTACSSVMQAAASNDLVLDQQSSENSRIPSHDTTLGYLNAKEAAALDVELMATPGFSLEQLMELAGLSVAEAVYQVVQDHVNSTCHTCSDRTSNKVPSLSKQKILVVCGPGNNGGDGLVAARHLVMFGIPCTIVYPKPSQKQHFINLVQQCEDVGIELRTDLPEDIHEEYSAMVDAIFGFSFHGVPREPFASILQSMVKIQQEKGTKIISVDIPSGWDVDTGDETNDTTGFVPDVLISLTAPKLSSKSFQGRHFVGGRFLPPKFADKYGIRMPAYPGVAQVMEVGSATDNDGDGDTSWEAQYAEHCADKERDIASNDAPNREEEESWEVQYARYCAEQESDM